MRDVAIPTHHVAPLRTLLESLEAAQASTRDAHAEAIRAARVEFETRLVQHVARRAVLALDAILGE